MTLDEFYCALEKTPRTWCVDRTGFLRIGWSLKARCPLGAVSSFSTWNDSHELAYKAAESLSLSVEDTKQIIYAADDLPNHDQTVRARLLRACGLRVA